MQPVAPISKPGTGSEYSSGKYHLGQVTTKDLEMREITKLPRDLKRNMQVSLMTLRLVEDPNNTRQGVCFSEHESETLLLSRDGSKQQSDQKGSQWWYHP